MSVQEGKDVAPSFWAGGDRWTSAVYEANKVNNSRYGLLAQIPMICKGPKCPFIKACYIPKDQLEVGARCPIEVATIIDRFERYCKQLGVDEDNIVDLTLVRELVDCDIQITRAEMKLAIDADFVEQVVAAVDHMGNEHYKPELNKAVDYKEKLRKERHRILELLASTRKQQQQGQAMDPSTMAAKLMQRLRELQGTQPSKDGDA